MPTQDWLPYPCTKRWFLDAFAGPIGTLLRAVATGTPPMPGARDNVDTIAVIEQLYASVRKAGAAISSSAGSSTQTSFAMSVKTRTSGDS